MNITSNKKVLSLFSLVMINVLAVDSLRSLSIGAEYGLSIIFFYILGAVLFLIPVALVAAEMATGWPETGGIYIWLREAFGKRWGFFIIWLQWLYNIVWYPTIMSLMAATVAYLFNPLLAHSKLYMWCAVMALFWLATFTNWFGMKLSGWISSAATIFGTLLPFGFIITLVIIWLAQGKPSAINFTWHDFFPSLNNINSLALLSSILFSLIGLEMSAVHAGDVKNPKRDYPRALFISATIIIVTLVLGSLAIAIVIPQAKIQLASGLMDSFSIFFNAFHMPWMIPVIAILIVLGGMGGVAAWIIGPTKGIMVAAKDDNAPRFLAKQNKYGVPANTLVAQGIIFTFLSSFFILMPSINAAFNLLSVMTSQLGVMVYVLIFSAAIRLRYKKPNVERKYKVPGGNWVMWLICSIGIITCLVVLVLGFLPPSQIEVGSVSVYESILIGGVILICLPPFLMQRHKHK
jgi:putative glutamate/gamma-aminobutyrate antiporter